MTVTLVPTSASSALTATEPPGEEASNVVWLPVRHRLVVTQSTAAQLLDEAAAGPDDRVLIVGAPSAELLCEALRHGCRTAQEAAVPPKRPEPADVVVAPRIASEEDAMAVASCARRALADSPRGGRLALLVLGAGARALARSMVGKLRDYGFERIRLRARAEGDLLLVCRMSPAAIPVCAMVR